MTLRCLGMLLLIERWVLFGLDFLICCRLDSVLSFDCRIHVVILRVGIPVRSKCPSMGRPPLYSETEKRLLGASGYGQELY